MQKIIPFKKEVNFKDNVSEITSISLEHSLHREEVNQISGEFTVSGEYRVVDTSSVIDNFSFELPFDIHMDEKYDMSKAVIDIDDFYYEIINSNILSVHIDVLIDKIEEKEVEEVRMAEEEIPEVEMREVNLEEEVKGVEEVEAVKEEPIVEEVRTAIPVVPQAIEVPTLETVSKEEPRESIEPIMEETSKVEREENIEVVNKSMDTSAADTISSIFDNTNMEGGYATYHIYIIREEDTIESVIQKYGVTKESLEKYNDLKEVKMGDKLIIPCITSEKV